MTEPETITRTRRPRLMLLSVGSLLGQNVLDALGARRAGVEVIGLNSVAANPRNFRCDQVFLVPPMARAEAFAARFESLVERLRPDLILPGRDDDVVWLADWRSVNPQHPQHASVPCGAPELARVMRDKLNSADFAREHDLPFVATVSCADAQALNAFVARHAYPLIAKPRDGQGSNGVFLVCGPEQLARIRDLPGMILQQFLAPPLDLASRLAVWELAPPLFFQIPETSQTSVQALIAPDGSLTEICCTQNTMVMGRCERARRIRDPRLDGLMRRYAATLTRLGWVGMVNIQCKPDEQGDWMPYEVCLRMTGTSSARIHAGYDEIGLLMRHFCPDLPFEQLGRPDPVPGLIERSLTDQFIPDAWVERLDRDGCWQAETP